MKKIMLVTLTAAATFAPFSPLARAQAPEGGFRALLGYKSLNLDDHRFSHDTHPDDSFLPNSGVPGSAGTTDVGGMLHFAALGVGHQARLSDSLSLTFDVGGLIGGDRDRHQNVNDTRPVANGAFVYSEARFGLFTAAGVSYYIKQFYVGAEAQLAGVFIDSGWDRFGEDESERTEFDLLSSAGPKIGYSLTENFSVEGTVQFGHAVTFGTQGVWKF